MEDVLAAYASAGAVLIAVDFDNTVINMHTGGRSTEPELLASAFRPFFATLLRSAIVVGLPVAVTTFSTMEDEISAALALALPDVDTSKIIVRGADKRVWPDSEWKEIPGVFEHGKQHHILSVLTQMGHNDPSKLLDRVIFFDDDPRNIRKAVKCGMVWAFDVDPSMPELDEHLHNMFQANIGGK